MINVRCELETSGEVMQSVQSFIPEARLRERRPRQLIWHVQPNTLQISTLFKRMEEARAATPMVNLVLQGLFTFLNDPLLFFAHVW